MWVHTLGARNNNIIGWQTSIIVNIIRLSLKISYQHQNHRLKKWRGIPSSNILNWDSKKMFPKPDRWPKRKSKRSLWSPKISQLSAQVSNDAHECHATYWWSSESESYVRPILEEFCDQSIIIEELQTKTQSKSRPIKFPIE